MSAVRGAAPGHGGGGAAVRAGHRAVVRRAGGGRCVQHPGAAGHSGGADPAACAALPDRPRAGRAAGRGRDRAGAHRRRGAADGPAGGHRQPVPPHVSGRADLAGAGAGRAGRRAGLWQQQRAGRRLRHRGHAHDDDHHRAHLRGGAHGLAPAGTAGLGCHGLLSGHRCAAGGRLRDEVLGWRLVPAGRGRAAVRADAHLASRPRPRAGRQPP